VRQRPKRPKAAGGPGGDDSRRVGLARALSKLGYCSRSQAEQLIRAGVVKLNGVTKRDPETPVALDRDRIAVRGEGIGAAEKIHLLMNKPRGLVTTAADEKGRPTVYAALHGESRGQLHGNAPWVAPVGRLDKGSEGLLLLTNDPEWAAKITAPESAIAKTYHVQVSGVRDENLAQALVKGFVVANGEFLTAKRASVLRLGDKNTWLAITLEEGKNRHIRRMLEKLGVEVLRLVRVSIGPLALGDLAKGAVRPLTAAEKSALDAVLYRHPSGSGLK
jgi:23S rRNA pseudouridine2605 synthase